MRHNLTKYTLIIVRDTLVMEYNSKLYFMALHKGWDPTIHELKLVEHPVQSGFTKYSNVNVKQQL